MRFVFFLLLVLATTKTRAQQTADSLVERIILRNINFPRDNSINVHGTLLLEFQRSAGSIKVKILYNSISNFDHSLQKRINKWDIESAKKLPKRYRALVPVYVTQLTEQKIKIPPTPESIQSVEEKIKTIKQQIRTLKPIEIILYPVVRKTKMFNEYLRASVLKTEKQVANNY